MDITIDLKVADIVSNNIKTADVFKKHGIDFCCGGGISVEKACEKKEINPQQLLDELKNVGNSTSPTQNFINWELDFLVDYIVNVHHKYVLEAIQLLDAYSAKVAKVHGDNYPVLKEIERLYNIVKIELLQHMQKEEKILFPYIKQLVKAKNESHTMPNAQFGTVQDPIRMMHAEHENAGDILKEIATLSLNYTTPEWACNTFKALYAKLDEFEQDLHLHVHLENNVLFPKAIALENSLSELLN